MPLARAMRERAFRREKNSLTIPHYYPETEASVTLVSTLLS